MNALVTMPQFSMSDIERVAIAIAKGGLFGSKDPNAVLTLCLLAQAEGQHPAVVFRDYHLISGKPAKKAEAILRDFISAGGKVEWHALSDELADATFSHPQGGTVRIDWTMERARAAGIANPMWKKYPRQMLRSRVISEGARSVCPSATSGLYEENEVRDIVAETGGNVIEVKFTETIEPVNTGESEPTSDDRAAKGRNRAPGEPSKSELDTAEKELVSEIHACADSAMLDTYLKTTEGKRAYNLLRKFRPSAIDGPAPEHCPEYTPIGELILNKRAEFAREETNAALPEYIEQGIELMRAG